MSFDKTRALNLARKYVSRGQHRSAIAEYRAVYRNDPRCTHVLIKIAELYQHMKAPTEAVDAYVDAARAYRDKGFARRAVAAYELAVKIAPTQAHLRAELAALCVDQHQLAAARAHYDAAVTAYERAGLARPAIDALEQRLALDVNDVRVRLRLAASLVDQGELERAGGHYAVGLAALRAAGAKTAFIGVAARWLSAAPKNYPLRLELATALVDAGSPHRALSLLRACYREQPRDREMLDVLVRTLQALGCERRAARVAELRDNIAPAKTVPAETVPVEHAVEGEPRLAQGSMRQAAVIATPPPSEADRLYHEAAAFMKLGLVRQAEPLLRRALGRDPGHQRAKAALSALRGTSGPQ